VHQLGDGRLRVQHGRHAGIPDAAELESLQITDVPLVANSGSLTGYPSFGGNATMVYDFDSNERNTVLLNYNMNSGGGGSGTYSSTSRTRSFSRR
jgi:hypothetical protein